MDRFQPLVTCRWGLLALASGLALGAAAADLNPEERLQAVRQQLVQQALQGATQVRSTAWIDGTGALRESSSFRHGMEVRGVRVLSYRRDETGQPTAQVQWQSREDLIKPAAASAAAPATAAPPAPAQACAAETRLRHVVGWSLSSSPRWSIAEQHLAHQAGQMLTQGWHDAAGTSRSWRLLDLPATAEPAHSSYERLLTGGAPAARPAWIAQLRMERQAFLERGTPLPWSEREVIRLRVSLSLTQTETGQVLLRDTQDLPLQAHPANWGAPQLDVSSSEAVRQLAARWGGEFDKLLACQSVQAQVLQSQAGRVQIDQGTLAGLRPGEEWLISDRRQVPGHVIEPGLDAALVLARVERVEAQRAELRVVAGPQDRVRPQWQAWPLSKP